MSFGLSRCTTSGSTFWAEHENQTPSKYLFKRHMCVSTLFEAGSQSSNLDEHRSRRHGDDADLAMPLPGVLGNLYPRISNPFLCLKHDNMKHYKHHCTVVANKLAFESCPPIYGRLYTYGTCGRRTIVFRTSPPQTRVGSTTCSQLRWILRLGASARRNACSCVEASHRRAQGRIGVSAPLGAQAKAFDKSEAQLGPGGAGLDRWQTQSDT